MKSTDDVATLCFRFRLLKCTLRISWSMCLSIKWVDCARFVSSRRCVSYRWVLDFRIVICWHRTDGCLGIELPCFSFSLFRWKLENSFVYVWQLYDTRVGWQSDRGGSPVQTEHYPCEGLVLLWESVVRSELQSSVLVCVGDFGDTHLRHIPRITEGTIAGIAVGGHVAHVLLLNCHLNVRLNDQVGLMVQVLYLFLEFFSCFDWDSYCVSLSGPIPLELKAKPGQSSTGIKDEKLGNISILLLPDLMSCQCMYQSLGL